LGFAGGPNGLNISGSGYLGSAGANGTVLKLISGSNPVLSITNAVNLHFKNIWFHGNNLSSAVVSINPTAIIEFITFEDCIITNTVPSTNGVNGGTLMAFLGATEADSIHVVRCQIMQNDPVPAEDGGLLAPKALYCVSVLNPEATFVNFEHCFLQDAYNVVFFQNGSCNFRHCQLYNGITSLFFVNGIVPPFTLEDIFTQPSETGANANFFSHVANGSGSSAVPIVLRQCNNANTGTEVTISCIQPILMIGNVLAGAVSVVPDATNGIYRVVSIATAFNVKLGAPLGFVDASNRVDHYGDLNSNVSPPQFWNQMASATELCGFANYDQNISLAIATATGSATVINADSHVIGTLTGTRTYTLLTTDCQNGSRIRVSRLIASDTNGAIVKYGSSSITLSNVAGQPAWAEWVCFQGAFLLFAKGNA
jgi:hypothetical protein